MSTKSPSSPRSSALIARREAVVSRGVPRISTFAIDHAQGALLTDVDGREIIDLASGIGVTNLGHSDPAVVEAIAEQARRLQHVCIHVATYEPYVALCERLVQLLPHGGPTKALLLNSGAEAVENAVKIARQATGRSAIVSFSGGFHGRTLMGMSLTSKVAYKKGCGPFAPEIYHAPFPDPLHGGGMDDVDAFADAALAQLKRRLATLVSADHVAAFIVEPVQGEGGFIPIPPRFLSGLRALCDQHGILLILDEIQSGFGRVGAWGAYQRYGITPDLSTWAKAMGGGLPISAVVGKAEVMDAALPGTVGGTFGGNPIACAAALATLDRMEALDVCARAEVVGARIRARFEGMKARHKEIVDVRGLGAMIAMEVCAGGDLRHPATAEVSSLVRRCHERGVLVITAGVDGNVLRTLAPLTITDAQLDRALDIIEDSGREIFP